MTEQTNKIMVTKSFLPPVEEYIDEVRRIWGSHWLTNHGKIHQEYEEKILDYLQVPQCSLFTNGHLALEVAIKALNLEGEVITTPFTFASTTHAIVNNGLKPVFCDINTNNFTIDVNQIEALITKETTAILPVHVYGYPCAVEKIQSLAERYNLHVIYDAAHVFGVKINEVGIGNFGDVAMFSTHATKVFHSIEGGILTFKDPAYRRKYDLLKNFGISGPEIIELSGMNAKMNEFQAAMGLVNLRYIDQEIAKRKLVADSYRKHLENIQGIKYIEDMPGVKHNYAYFPIVIDEDQFGRTRNQVFERLQQYNIFTRKYFYPLVVDYDCYKEKYKCNIPNARYVSKRVLTLPMYGDLSISEVDFICNAILEIQREA